MYLINQCCSIGRYNEEAFINMRFRCVMEYFNVKVVVFSLEEMFISYGGS